MLTTSKDSQPLSSVKSLTKLTFESSSTTLTSNLQTIHPGVKKKSWSLRTTGWVIWVRWSIKVKSSWMSSLKVLLRITDKKKKRLFLRCHLRSRMRFGGMRVKRRVLLSWLSDWIVRRRCWEVMMMWGCTVRVRWVRLQKKVNRF